MFNCTIYSLEYIELLLPGTPVQQYNCIEIYSKILPEVGAPLIMT
jgi:hypothetical protein